MSHHDEDGPGGDPLENHPPEMSREMADLFGQPRASDAPPVRRGRGRPKGSQNRPKDAVMTQDKLRTLYTRIEPILTADHKKYLKEVIDGKNRLDPIKEMELLLRYGSILLTEAFESSLQQRNYSNQNLSKLMGELRMGLKDLSDMQRKQREEEEKRAAAADDSGLGDPTRESALARFEALHSGTPGR